MFEFRNIIRDFRRIYRSIISQAEEIHNIAEEIHNIRLRLDGDRLVSDDLVMLSHHFRRNFLPNDDSAIQKSLMMSWSHGKSEIIGYKELLESGFRVYSQNDEDGILLRIFSHIEPINKYIIEIGSNCSDSDIGIPENLSTNLIVNHGWHGTIFEINEIECERMTHFFARHLSTKHFHWFGNEKHEYYSPRIIHKEVDATNINSIIQERLVLTEPDLMAIDIDGRDYAVIRALTIIRPRVLVVEFEKRFRDRYSVVQFDSAAFSKRWAQSGAASLPAWEKLLM